MKKRIEADLISLAHRVLKLKNKSDVDVLLAETRKLYETLSVLKFYNDNFDLVKNDISEVDLEEKLTANLEVESVENLANPVVEEPKIVPETIAVTEPEPFIEKKELDFEPLFEMTEAPEFVPKKLQPKEISFEELIGKSYIDTDFVKPSENIKKEAEIAKPTIDSMNLEALTDKKTQGISIGLNDRIGFEQQLFGGSTADFNRVLSQLNTFDTLAEANDFINEMVKPEYDNWKDKDDFADRFIDIIKTKFN